MKKIHPYISVWSDFIPHTCKTDNIGICMSSVFYPPYVNQDGVGLADHFLGWKSPDFKASQNEYWVLFSKMALIFNPGLDNHSVLNRQHGITWTSIAPFLPCQKLEGLVGDLGPWWYSLYRPRSAYTVGSCIVVAWYWWILPKSLRVTALTLALGQSFDCPCVNQASLKNMGI